MTATACWRWKPVPRPGPRPACPSAKEPDRAAVAWGTGLGARPRWKRPTSRCSPRGRRASTQYTVVRVMANSAASHLSMKYQLRAAQLAVSNACASSAQAMGEAPVAAAHGRADLALVGGSESLLHVGSLLCWQAMGVMAKLDAAAPAESCRPFDDARQGLVLGEGAAALVLETEAHAQARGAGRWPSWPAMATAPTPSTSRGPTPPASNAMTMARCRTPACARPTSATSTRMARHRCRRRGGGGLGGGHLRAAWRAGLGHQGPARASDRRGRRPRTRRHGPGAAAWRLPANAHLRSSALLISST